MAPTARRRVSYVIPTPSDNVPRLRLPLLTEKRFGQTQPHIIQIRHAPETPKSSPRVPRHPRHRLGVSSLAIDTTTQLTGRSAPEGILYTGGRDGLINSWDLQLPMCRRQDGATSGSGEVLQRRIGRWELMTGWADDVIDEEVEEEERIGTDGDVLGDVSMNSARRRRRAAKDEYPFGQRWEIDLEAFKPGQPTQFRQSAEAHADWVNDLLLCNFNQTIVSASSDGFVKSWNPHSDKPLEPVTLGSHSDYVRCLALCREQNWVASGSFDRTVKLWDLNRHDGTPLITLNPPDAMAPKSSIYALAVDPYGHSIATGSPERVIRMWDPRSGKRTGKLAGHTDNIRSILLSDDSKYLLSASADASIKLWSLTSQRCLHTFTHHTDSVWSLYSTHPSLEVFYSGDKTGYVCKVDVENCTDISEGECIVICQDAGENNNMATAEGINKIVAIDDSLLWTASGSSSIKRWRVPQRRAVRAQALVLTDTESNVKSPSSPISSSPDHLRSSPTSSPRPHSHSRTNTMATSATVTSQQSRHHRPSPSARNSLTPSFTSSSGENWSASASATVAYSREQHEQEEESTLYGIPFESLVRLTSPNEQFLSFAPRGRDPDVATLYSAASIVSVPRPPPIAASGGALRSPPAALHSSAFHGHMHHLPSGSPMRGEDMSGMGVGGAGTVASHVVNTARLEYEERDIASEAVPLHAEPDEVIHGEHGLVRSILLNDRVHALTVDTAGEVAVWNIVRGLCLGKYAHADVVAAGYGGSGSGAGGSGGGDSGDGRSGDGGESELSPREMALEAVRMRIEGMAVIAPWCTVGTKLGVLAVHITERCFEAEMYADEAGFSSDRHFGDEMRINVGKWALRNIFLNFIRQEQHVGRRRDTHPPDDLVTTGIHRSNAPTHIDFSRPGGIRSRASSLASRRSSSSIAIVSSPAMVPAMPPPVPQTTTSSPLIAPLIPLNLTNRDGTSALPPLTTIPQSPLTPTNNNSDATPMPRVAAAISHGSTTPGAPSFSTDYFTVPMRTASSNGEGAVPATPDEFSGWSGPSSFGDKTGSDAGSVPATPSTPGGLMGRLKNFGKSSKKGNPEMPSTPIGSDVGSISASSETAVTPATKTPLEILFSHHLTPPSSSEVPSIRLPEGMAVQLAEETSSGWKTVYRGTITSTHEDWRELEQAMPIWLLEYLLMNRITVPPVVKIGFLLLPWREAEERSRDQLPELLNAAQSKLTASRFLRVRKMTLHVQEKLDKISSSTSSSTPHHDPSHPSSYAFPHAHMKTVNPVQVRAEETYEILCQDQLLPLDMTLAAVQHFVWRQRGGIGELVMHYRRRRKAN